MRLVVGLSSEGVLLIDLVGMVRLGGRRCWMGSATFATTSNGEDAPQLFVCSVDVLRVEVRHRSLVSLDRPGEHPHLLEKLVPLLHQGRRDVRTGDPATPRRFGQALLNSGTELKSTSPPLQILLTGLSSPLPQIA